MDIYKYDLTNAEKDGAWNSSYVSTGVRDENGIEAILGSTQTVNSLGNGDTAYGYALKGVVFSYVKIADICAYTAVENNTNHVEVLYGIEHNEATNRFLNALGLSIADRYVAADNENVYAYQSDVLIDGLKNALAENSTSVKNALEADVRGNGGTALPETDEYGHSHVDGLPLGLYLFVETRVPETVTETTAPFLVSLPMTSITDGASWIYDLFLSGTPIRGIQEYLEGNNIPNINGEPKWARNAINSILTNEKYCGDVLLQKTYIDDCINRKSKKNTGQLPMYLVQNHHEGIISRVLFDAAQAEFAKRNAGKSPSTKNAPTGRSRYSGK